MTTPIAHRHLPTLRRTADDGAQAEALAAELRREIRGDVRFDRGSRALYATDASNYRQVPIGVVLPKDADDVVATLAACHRRDVPVLSRGGGTSLAGQCCNVAVVMDMSRHMNRILEIDPERRTARVQPGVVLDTLRDAAEEHHLTFGPDPATHSHCTLGGMMGNNSCGVHALMAGKTVDNVDEMEIVTYDGVRMRVGATSEEELAAIGREGGRRGEIYRGLARLRDRYAGLVRDRYPHIPRRVSGYNLDQLLAENGFHVARALVGSESTCVTILEATLRLIPSPRSRYLVVAGYRDVYHAADDVPEVLKSKPIGLEGIDDVLVDLMKQKALHADSVKLLPEGKGWLFVEFGDDDPAGAEAQARAFMARLAARRDAPSAKMFDTENAKLFWKVREAGLGATARNPGARDASPGWEDAAVPPEVVGKYLREFRALLGRYDYSCALYGHFGQGCVHCRIDFDLLTHSGIAKWRAFLHEAAHLVVRHGGSLSGEHGDGQARGELLPILFGDELVSAFHAFKSLWDPAWKMNPGKVVEPRRVDENLRFGTAYDPPAPETHFKLPDDDGSFARATTRCVGIGNCRREGGGTMCPSYMATREEQHSTRGRARLLFEMLEGDVLRGGWRDESVREALDLCLACKGCKGECPVEVDMATYKAEFLSHYYAGRLRPRAAYSMGFIDVWARLAAKAPSLANFVMAAPVLASAAKLVGGVAPQRRMPRFAAQTFKSWFRSADHAAPGKPRVILWPDTFNNAFHPEVAIAATRFLETAGYEVTLPKEHLCCGRPLYDFGFLHRAKRLLRRTLDVLHPDIAAGVPVVGLEPSCVAVFRDELVNLFPHDEDAKRLSHQTYALSELLVQGPVRVELPSIGGRVLLHGHCHHKSILGMRDELAVLSRLGLEVDAPEPGCCGMAGSFGFERSHYDLSRQVGERALLPAVRAATADTVILANGFSCREQIEQSTSRRPVHLAEVLSAAIARGVRATQVDALVEVPRKRAKDVPRAKATS
ncbi:MAG TPA: FAD-binding and (Fe-S)-binding domain-containing protein [Byssovorax sp.]|jgi:FAD/FMN-containing dehydrogenase/Fe-S oxidoreductase